MDNLIAFHSIKQLIDGRERQIDALWLGIEGSGPSVIPLAEMELYGRKFNIDVMKITGCASGAITKLIRILIPKKVNHNYLIFIKKY